MWAGVSVGVGGWWGTSMKHKLLHVGYTLDGLHEDLNRVRNKPLAQNMSCSGADTPSTTPRRPPDLDVPPTQLVMSDARGGVGWWSGMVGWCDGGMGWWGGMVKWDGGV